MDHETVEKMIKMVDQSESFKEFLDQFIRVWCRECDRIFASRLEREEHGKNTHSRENPVLVEKDLSKDDIPKQKENSTRLEVYQREGKYVFRVRGI